MVTNTVVTADKFDRRTLINLSKGQYEWIRKQAFKKKMSVSELIRDVIKREMDSGGQVKTG